MKRSLVALALLTLLPGTAPAAPGDPRVLQGTLEWPPSVSTQPFMVVRSGDGRLLYVDVGSAQRRAPGPLGAGSRVAVLGIEGARPYELAAIAFGPGDAATLGLPAPTSPAPPPSVAPPPPGVPGSSADDLWRLDGTVQAVSGRIVTVRPDDGQAQATVDISELSPVTARSLQVGDRVSLFGIPRADRRLIANGYIQTEAPPPAASPRMPQ